MDSKLKQKFREAYEGTIDNCDLLYTGNLKNIDCFKLIFQAGIQDKIYKFFGLNTCMFNYVHNEQDSVLIVFSIPNGEDYSTKYIADKVMDIVELGESVFVTIDYINSKEIKDDKFIYVVMIKKVTNKN